MEGLIHALELGDSPPLVQIAANSELLLSPQIEVIYTRKPGTDNYYSSHLDNEEIIRPSSTYSTYSTYSLRSSIKSTAQTPTTMQQMNKKVRCLDEEINDPFSNLDDDDDFCAAWDSESEESEDLLSVCREEETVENDSIKSDATSRDSYSDDNDNDNISYSENSHTSSLISEDPSTNSNDLKIYTMPLRRELGDPLPHASSSEVRSSFLRSFFMEDDSSENTEDCDQSDSELHTITSDESSDDEVNSQSTSESAHPEDTYTTESQWEQEEGRKSKPKEYASSEVNEVLGTLFGTMDDVEEGEGEICEKIGEEEKNMIEPDPICTGDGTRTSNISGLPNFDEQQQHSYEIENSVYSQQECKHPDDAEWDVQHYKAACMYRAWATMRAQEAYNEVMKQQNEIEVSSTVSTSESSIASKIDIKFDEISICSDRTDKIRNTSIIMEEDEESEKNDSEEMHFLIETSEDDGTSIEVTNDPINDSEDKHPSKHDSAIETSEEDGASIEVRLLLETKIVNLENRMSHGKKVPKPNTNDKEKDFTRTGCSCWGCCIRDDSIS